MPRYKLVLEYDGTPYVGWQRQDNGPSVQQSLEQAIAAFCGEQTRAFAAGRTDAGVHALRQTVHVDINRDEPELTVQKAVNFYLKKEPISAIKVIEVAPDFHARFSATSRTYVYRILNRPAPPSLDREHSLFSPPF